MPAVRPAAGPGRAHLPPDERPSALTRSLHPSDTAAALALLAEGELVVEGRLVDASNATLYCTVSAGELAANCVYKPVRGERPLWDFPDGTLAGRELAAYLVSEATGWRIVPPTVMRDGPFGPGMCQLWIEVDDQEDVAALVRSGDPALRPVALFDAVINNADRKGGHLLPTADGHVYGVDHGVSLHQEPKLRTVLWGWRGTRFTGPERDVLEQLADCLQTDLAAALAEHLTDAEVLAVRRRLARLLRRGVFPSPSGDWPPIPWPPF